MPNQDPSIDDRIHALPGELRDLIFHFLCATTHKATLATLTRCSSSLYKQLAPMLCRIVHMGHKNTRAILECTPFMLDGTDILANKFEYHQFEYTKKLVVEPGSYTRMAGYALQAGLDVRLARPLSGVSVRFAQLFPNLETLVGVIRQPSVDAASDDKPEKGRGVFSRVSKSLQACVDGSQPDSRLYVSIKWLPEMEEDCVFFFAHGREISTHFCLHLNKERIVAGIRDEYLDLQFRVIRSTFRDYWVDAVHVNEVIFLPTHPICRPTDPRWGRYYRNLQTDLRFTFSDSVDQPHKVTEIRRYLMAYNTAWKRFLESKKEGDPKYLDSHAIDFLNVSISDFEQEEMLLEIFGEAAYEEMRDRIHFSGGDAESCGCNAV